MNYPLLGGGYHSHIHLFILVAWFIVSTQTVILNKLTHSSAKNLQLCELFMFNFTILKIRIASSNRRSATSRIKID